MASETRKRARKIKWRARAIARRLRPATLRRWHVERCEHCKQRRRFTESWCTYGNRDGKVWHGPCIAYEQWRAHATERLEVLDLICDTWGISHRDVTSLVELRTENNWQGSAARNAAWRVMHSLDQKREKDAEVPR